MMLSILCRHYEHPHPEQSVILEGVSLLKQRVEESLRAGTIRGCKFTVPFRFDVFHHLFSRKPNWEYIETDFPSHLFAPGWDTVYSCIGDGCRVVFPIIMKPSVQWSKKCYWKQPDGSLKLKPRFFTEVLHIKLNKTRCN